MTEREADRAIAILKCANIVKWFGGLQSLRGVSLEVMPGEVVALVGDNGAGKSTLVKTLSGLHRPDAGEIWLDGVELQHLTPTRARELGIETVHQELGLCENLDVIANVVLGQEPVRFGWGPFAFLSHRSAQAAATARLEEVGVHIDNLKASVRRLSGGQRQAIAIARAMIHAPRVMILDEPTAALGVHQTRATLRIIRSVAQRGIAVVVISHNMEDVFVVADRVVVLRLGSVVLDKPITETTPQQVVVGMTSGSAEQAT